MSLACGCALALRKQLPNIVSDRSWGVGTLIPGKSPARAQSRVAQRRNKAQGAGTAQRAAGKPQKCNTTGAFLSAATAAGPSPGK